jgi:hypothetical protein
VPEVLKRRNIMYFTRRQFLLTTCGSGIGFILPSFYEKALTLWENHGEILLRPAPDAKTILYAYQEMELELNLGDPRTEPPQMIRREFIEKYVYGGLETYFEELPYLEEHEKYDLDAEVDFLEVLDGWGLVDSPWAKAYKYLKNLDLGPDFTSPDAVGGISTVTGGPASSFIALRADDDVSLSLLQERLNQLKTGIAIQLV